MMNEQTKLLLSRLEFSGMRQLHYSPKHRAIRFTINTKAQVNIYPVDNKYSIGTIIINDKHRTDIMAITSTTWEYICAVIDYYDKI